ESPRTRLVGVARSTCEGNFEPARRLYTRTSIGSRSGVMRMTAILAFGVSILASSGAFAQASPLGSERPGLPALEFTLSDETLQAEYLRDARPVNIERGELSAGVFLSEE